MSVAMIMSVTVHVSSHGNISDSVHVSGYDNGIDSVHDNVHLSGQDSVSDISDNVTDIEQTKTFPITNIVHLFPQHFYS